MRGYTVTLVSISVVAQGSSSGTRRHRFFCLVGMKWNPFSSRCAPLVWAPGPAFLQGASACPLLSDSSFFLPPVRIDLGAQ